MLVGLAAAAALLAPSFSGAEPLGNRLAAAPPAQTPGAVKILVNKDGWYKVDGTQLAAAGLPLPTDPTQRTTLHLYAGATNGPYTGGVEVPFVVRRNRIEFYGQGLDTLYTDTRAYWLVSGPAGAPRVPNIRATASPAAPGNFAFTTEIKPRQYYLSALRNGSASNFFGPFAGPSSPTNQTIAASNVETSVAAPTGSLQVSLQPAVGTPSSHTVNVTLNGTSLGSVSWSGPSGSDLGGGTLTVPAGLVTNGNNIVGLQTTSGTDFVYTDFIRLTYRHLYTADNNALAFPASPGVAVTVGGFTNSDVRVIDATNPQSPRELTGSVTGSGPYQVTLKPPAGATQLLAFAPSAIQTPVSVAADQASNLKSGGQGANLLIISHSSFINATLNSLVAQRQSEGYQVKVADVQDVFDEFADGAKTPDAISRFLQYASANYSPAPSYLLLVGDATYDPRNYLGVGSFDFVPTKMLDNSFSESPSDDELADFNSDGVPELAVGRLPVRTAAPDETTVVNKIVTYAQTSISSPRTALLVSDAAVGYNFVQFSDQLEATIHTNDAGAVVTRRNRPDPPTPAGDASIHNQIVLDANTGPTIVNYFGHGKSQVWADLSSPIFSNADPPNLTNTKLSLYLMMTCLNGNFVEPNASGASLGEKLLLAPKAAVASWASSGDTVPFDQVNADTFAVGLLLSDPTKTLGQAMVAAKASISDPDVRHTWVLLGDPTTKLK
jgi:peptidase C25-like protein